MSGGLVRLLDEAAERSDYERPDNLPTTRRAYVERATEDIRVERPDLGPDTYTVVRRSQVIPKAFTGFQRSPVSSPRRKAKASQ